MNLLSLKKIVALTSVGIILSTGIAEAKDRSPILKMKSCVLNLRGVGYPGYQSSECGVVKYAVDPQSIVPLLIAKGYQIKMSAAPNNRYCGFLGKSVSMGGVNMNYTMNEMALPAWENLILVLDFPWTPLYKKGTSVWGNANLYQMSESSMLTIFSATAEDQADDPHDTLSGAAKALKSLPRCEVIP